MLIVTGTPAGTSSPVAPAAVSAQPSTAIPHFDLPFRYANGKPVVNEQDSVEDVVACVTAILLTEPGTRDEMPEFGFEDPAFSQQPITSNAIAAQVSQWEPRVNVLVDVAPDALDSAIADANIYVEVTS